MKSENDGRIQLHSTYVQVDFVGCPTSEMRDLCARFAIACMTQSTRGALLKGGDEDQERCQSMCDTVSTMKLVLGTPPDFKVALVPSAPAAAQVCEEPEARLRALRVEARSFESEQEGARWLQAGAT